MSDNVIPLGTVTKLEIPVDKVLEGAKGKLDGGVIVIGWDHDGELYFASSMSDGREVLWLLAMCEKALLSTGDTTNDS